MSGESSGDTIPNFEELSMLSPELRMLSPELSPELRRTFDDAGPPPGTAVFFFQGILGRSRPEIGRLYRKCG